MCRAAPNRRPTLCTPPTCQRAAQPCPLHLNLFGRGLPSTVLSSRAAAPAAPKSRPTLPTPPTPHLFSPANNCSGLRKMPIPILRMQLSVAPTERGAASAGGRGLVLVAVGETAILLHPKLSLLGVATGTKREWPLVPAGVIVSNSIALSHPAQVLASTYDLVDGAAAPCGAATVSLESLAFRGHVETAVNFAAPGGLAGAALKETIQPCLTRLRVISVVGGRVRHTHRWTSMWHYRDDQPCLLHRPVVSSAALSF